MSNWLERETSVLIPGIGLGAEKAAVETWQGLQKAGSDFVHNPLQATGHYLGDHWKDLAAGALISFVAPRGLVNKLLIGWSLRGVAQATGEAMVDAADPDADVGAIRARYAAQLGHQGAAFASSLPMTMAGGALGRMAGNTVFGAGNSLTDLAAGRVSLADVRGNVRNFYDTLHPSKPDVLVTDLDDTVFSLKSYLVPSLKRNISMISERMNLPEDEVIRDLGPHRMHPWILEESPLARKFKGTPAEFTEQIVKPFWRNDAEAMEHLRAYPTVPETLAQARERGVKVVALTNAPAPWALRRLRATGLDKYIDDVYAMDAYEPEASHLVAPQAAEHGRMLVDQALNAPSAISADHVHLLPPGYQKPDVRGLQTVLNDTGVSPRKALAIGDNWDQDGSAPEALGVPYIWAKYGRQVPADWITFLRRFGPRTDETAVEAHAPDIAAEHPRTVMVADSYSDLMNYLNRRPNFSRAWQIAAADMSSRAILTPTLGYNLLNFHLVT